MFLLTSQAPVRQPPCHARLFFSPDLFKKFHLNEQWRAQAQQTEPNRHRVQAELGAECALKEEPAITTSTSTFGANVSATTLCGNRTAMQHAHQMKSSRAHSTHRTSRTTLATARPRRRNLSRSWTHEVRVRDCHNASCRVGVCGGLPSSIVVAWTPQLLARCAGLINVEICFWLTRVLHRDQESTALRRPPANCQGGRTAQVPLYTEKRSMSRGKRDVEIKPQCPHACTQ